MCFRGPNPLLSTSNLKYTAYIGAFITKIGLFKRLAIGLVIAQLAISVYFIAGWTRWAAHLICSLYNIPRSEWILGCPMDEYQLIVALNRNTPPEARILWKPRQSLVSNYHLFPRKIYQPEQFSAQSDAISVSREFLESRRINYVLFDYSRVYPLEALDITADLVKPGYVMLRARN